MTLLLVRHGQASAGSHDYDRLSERGHEQSRRLGAWLAASGHRFGRVVLGGMRRHRETFEALAEGYGAALPEPHVDDGFAEFDHHAVFGGFAKAAPDHPAVAAVAREGLAAMAPMIHAALEAWAGDGVGEVPESWAAFGARVCAAGDRLAHDHERALVVTSGGVIARLAQCALGASDRAAVDLNLSLRNSGLCEFRARPRLGHAAPCWSDLGLASWNAVPHLHDARELWTYY